MSNFNKNFQIVKYKTQALIGSLGIFPVTVTCTWYSVIFLLYSIGSEDEPAPNQYDYKKGKDQSMRRSPSYTIQQGRRGGTVFWMARG